jgi:adenylate cyclase
MTVEDGIIRQVVQSLSSAVAVADTASWDLMFENALFFSWFESTDELATADQRIPGFKADRATSRMAENRPYGFDTVIEVRGRELPIRVEVRRLADSDNVALIECTDASKVQEIQYMLDSYSNLAERNARELQKERDRVEKLLLNIMPRAVFDELKDYGTATPQRFDEATILMLDFVGFTDMAVASDPSAIISELNDIFSSFDRIAETFGAERIKTIGDAYMAVSGVPEANPDHAANIARTALRIRRYLERRNAAHPQEWRARIGINTGPVIGSLVGVQRYVYDLFGPGVNLAARMETISEPMQITLNEATASLLEDDFVLSELGEFEIKGFGSQRLFRLESEIRSFRM